MRFIAANLTVIVWAFVFGMVVGYIGSALAKTSVNFVASGVVAAIIAVIAVNGVHAFMNSKIS